MNKDLRKLVKLALKQGWRFEQLRGGHYRFLPPKGDPIVAAASGSDHRGWKNMIARLRAAGLKIPR